MIVGVIFWNSSVTGWLFTKLRNPSTSPFTSGVGSFCTITLVTFDSSILLILSSELQSVSFSAWMPIFLPIMSSGLVIGFEGSDTMQNGLRCRYAPSATSFAP